MPFISFQRATWRGQDPIPAILTRRYHSSCGVTFGGPPLTRLWCPARMFRMHPGVEVWICGLEAAAELAGRYLPLLSADELERAGRFKLDHLREAYILGRGVTRSILAQRMDADPSAIRFEYSSYGKPSLA